MMMNGSQPRETARKRSPGRGRRLARGLLLLVAAFLLLVNISFGLLLTKKSSDAMISLIRARMLDISNTASAMIDGDSLERLTKEDADNGSEDFRRIMETLTYFQDNIDLEYIYCISDTGDGNFVFSVDPTVVDPGEFGSPVVYTDALYRASLGTATVDDEPYHDAWGTFYSAYSPVFTSDGRVGGIVAVDFSASWYDQQVKDLMRTAVTIGLMSLAVGVLIVVLVTRWNRRKYRDLYNQLGELAGRFRELVTEIENGAELPASGQSALPAERKRQGEDVDALESRILSMQEDVGSYIERFREKVYVDALTGLGNRTAYLDAVQQLDEQIRAGDASFAVAVFDLNALKAINDNYGHEYGDRALIDAAKILKSIFREERLYRIGGDEFVAIMEQTSEAVMELLFESVDQACRLSDKGQKSTAPALVLSKGAAIYVPGEDATYQAVFERADLAMYDDKRAYYLKNGDRRRR